MLTGGGSGIGYALYTIFGNAALKKYQPLTVTFYTFLFAAIGILPVSHVRGMIELAGEKTVSILVGVMLGVISTLIPFLLYTNGLKNAAPGKASILAFAEPFVATITGIVLFHEKTTVIGIFGLSCIFASICILNGKSK